MAGVCEGKCMGYSLGDEPQTSTRCIVVGCYNYMKYVGGDLSVAILRWQVMVCNKKKFQYIYYTFTSSCHCGVGTHHAMK